VARRFGAGLLDALDAALGERPESYPWLTLPEVFDEKLELPALATTAPDLLAAAQHLLATLQAWLRARQQGILALELEWTLDLKRHNGVLLPPHQQLVVRTARPTQGMAHLRRLVGEQLGRVTLAAPANHLRLRSLETTPWAGASNSLLPEDLRKGERLHELVERLSVRLGADHVLVPVACADHRPERMQRWVPAAGGASPLDPAQGRPPGPKGLVTASDALYPSWLLREPLPLQVRNHVPHYRGPLQRLTRAQRIEAGWWDAHQTVPAAEPHQAALRDYFIARSEQAGLLWIYCERPTAGQDAVRWFLHGVFA
jgi:protein ImuB